MKSVRMKMRNETCQGMEGLSCLNDSPFVFPKRVYASVLLLLLAQCLARWLRSLVLWC